MTKAARLLQRAYALVDKNRIEDAALVLDAVVEEEPQNVEAWELYLQISSTRSELEWLGKRIQSQKDLRPEDKKTILGYQRYLIGQLQSKTNVRLVPSSQRQFAPFSIVVVVLTIVVLFVWSGPPSAKIFLGILVVGSVLLWSWKDRAVLVRRVLGPRRFAKELKLPELNQNDPKSLPGGERPLITYDKPIIKIGPENLPVIKLGKTRRKASANRQRDRRFGAGLNLKPRSKE
jgi:hypothetical protein